MTAKAVFACAFCLGAGWWIGILADGWFLTPSGLMLVGLMGWVAEHVKARARKEPSHDG